MGVKVFDSDSTETGSDFTIVALHASLFASSKLLFEEKFAHFFRLLLKKTRHGTKRYHFLFMRGVVSLTQTRIFKCL